MSSKKSKSKHADPSVAEEPSPIDAISPHTPSALNEDSSAGEFIEPEPLEIRKISSEEEKEMRNYSLDEIKEVDQVATEAIRLFFKNQVKDCENILEEHWQEDPINMAGAGLVAFLRYILSMEQPQADIALRHLEAGSSFSGRLHPDPGAMSKGMKKLGGMFSKSDPKSKWLKPGEFRAKVIHAECQAIRCFVLVLQQSIGAVMKGGLALRRAYNLYHSLHKEIEERKKIEGKPLHELGVDLNSIYCVDFGLGAINIALSLLPGSVSSMLNFFGMTSDRDRGFALVRNCFDSNTLLSPFAGALLLGIYGMIPFFSPILIPKHVPLALSVAEETLSKPGLSHSLFHLWLVARITRLERRVERSSKYIDDCLNDSDMKQIIESMPQLRHIAIYDQVINKMILFKWNEAIDCCKILHTESKWSQIFYLYLEGCCFEMLAHECLKNEGSEKELEYRKKATESYWKAMHNKVTVLGGKVMRVDQFVAKRLTEIAALADVPHPNPDNKQRITELKPLDAKVLLKNLVSLPSYEIIVLFSLSHQVPKESFERMTTELWEQLQWEMPFCENATAQALSKTAEAFIQANSDCLRATPVGNDEQKAELQRRVRQMNAITDGYGRMLFYTTAIATLMTNAEDDNIKEKALPLLKAVIATPKYKDKQTSLSYCRPLAMYEEASLSYFSSGKDAELTLSMLDKFSKAHNNAHYFFHSAIETKCHLVSQYLKKPTDTAAESTADPSSKPASPMKSDVSINTNSELEE